jgi:hypothetical protein
MTGNGKIKRCQLIKGWNYGTHASFFSVMDIEQRRSLFGIAQLGCETNEKWRTLFGQNKWRMK